MEIESIKKKVLEDVDPELKRKKAREMRKQRIIVSIQFLGLIAVIILLFYMFRGISTGGWRFHVSYTSRIKMW